MDTYRTSKDNNLFIPYLVNKFFDFESFMDPYMLSVNYNINGVRGCQYFKLHLVDGTPIMKCKASTWDENWSPYINVRHSFPNDYP